MTNFDTFQSDEKSRLASVLDYEILDTQYEKDLDDLTHFAAKIFDMPIVLITILDDRRQWFKSNYGLTFRETDRSISFCQYTILENKIFEVYDTLEDTRFNENPLVRDFPKMRSYCGTPLVNEEGFAMGSLALIDLKPRKLSEEEKEVLRMLARQVVIFFELMNKKKKLEKEKTTLERKVRDRTMELEDKIRELEKRDKKLDSLNSELNRFIYKLSHDLLGPLKSIQGVTNIALGEVKEENILGYLKLLQTSEQKLDHTLVSLIKLLTINEEMNFLKIDWKQLIKNATLKATKRNPEKKLELQLEILSEETFYSDPVLVEIMLEELLSNSLQYNYNPISHVDLRIVDGKDHILIEVIDNGIGVREEEKDKIFEMFYKTDKSTGSGLGLYITKNIVEKLGGQIAFDSHKNKGSRFQILVPLEN